MENNTPKPEIDWESIEREYRAGQLSLREIAAQYGVSHEAIRKRAKRDGWERALADRVRKGVRERLTRLDGGVDDRVDGPVDDNGSCQPQRADDDEVAKKAEIRGLTVVVSHRKDLQQLHALKRILAERLSQHLDGLTPDGPCLGERESPGDLLVKLSRVTAQLIPLERQAYNLDEEEGGGGTTPTDVDALRRSMSAKLKRIADAQRADA